MSRPDPQIHPVDVAVAVTTGFLGVAAGVARRAGSALGPVADGVLRPRLLPERLHPATYLEAASRSGEERREALRRTVARQLDEVVPVVVEEVVRRAGLTDVVLRHVDLEAVVDAVDLDEVVAKVDVSAVVERVDLDAAAARLDIDAVLDRIDLTAVVLRRVDLRAIVEAVLDRLDLIGLAVEVIDGVDLPEIIRESTGSMASDTVRGVRMQGVAADEAVGRAVDRLLLRHRGRAGSST